MKNLNKTFNFNAKAQNISKAILTILFMVITFTNVFSQEFCEIRSDGMLVPRLDRNNVNTTEMGLIVFDVNTNSLWLHDGNDWIEQSSSNQLWSENNGDLFYNSGAVEVSGLAYDSILEDGDFQVSHPEGSFANFTTYSLNFDGQSIQAKNRSLDLFPTNSSTVSNFSLNPLGGNVGIGEADPTSNLHIIGNAENQEVVDITSTTALPSSYDLVNLEMPSGSDDNSQFIEARFAGSTRFDVDATGDVFSAGNITSDNLRTELTPTNPSTNTVYGNGLPIAYGYIQSNSVIATDYGVASVSNPSVGVYTINLNNSISGQPVILATAYAQNPSDEIATGSRIDNNTIEINIANGSGTAISSNFYFLVFGTPQ